MTLVSPKFLCNIKLLSVHIKPIYLSCSLKFSSLYHSKANSSKAPHCNSRAWSHHWINNCSSPSSADTTAQDATFVEVSSWIDFCCRNFSNHCVLRESTATHEVKDWNSIFRESSGAIRHQSFSLRSTNLRTEICF